MWMLPWECMAPFLLRTTTENQKKKRYRFCAELAFLSGRSGLIIRIVQTTYFLRGGETNVQFLHQKVDNVQRKWLTTYTLGYIP